MKLSIKNSNKSSIKAEKKKVMEALKMVRQHKKIKIDIISILIYTYVLVTAAFCLLPILYVISVSLTDPSVYVPFEFRLIPKKISFAVYSSILSTPAFVTALK